MKTNKAELAFEARAESNGWFVTKRGWPDFICELPDGRVIVVEVKPTRRDGKPGSLKLSQCKVMEWLTENGIRCFVSDGKILEPFDPKYHRRHGFEREKLFEDPRGRAEPKHESFTFIA